MRHHIRDGELPRGHDGHDMPGDSRAANPLLRLGVVTLLWLLLSTTCSPFWAQTHRFLSGPLSVAEQAAYADANRTLILDQVGLLSGVSVTDVGDSMQTADDEVSVVGVTTGVRFTVPSASDFSVEAWWETHPNVAGGPSAELDAAFNENVYGPVWRVLDQLAGRLENLGFERHVEDQTGPSLLTRSVGLRRKGVTVWLRAEYPGGVVEVSRTW